uniref:Uncharacterized protein n=1 Tax=Trichobilharzia regenti TaxID=157069 RepID=A0AA85KBW5_TRIRE|nr:unnamed protein product [Trichobilharzia regenti]
MTLTLNWIILVCLYTTLVSQFQSIGTQGLELSGNRFSRQLHRRSLYELDAYRIEFKPELKANHGQNFTHIMCRVNRPKPNAEVYLTCPALGDNKLLGNCYQGCQPTNPCLHSSQRNFGCVPHDQTVFCQKIEYPNGTIVINLKVDRSDKRLTGLWSCTHAGLESTKFEIDLKSYSNGNQVVPESKPLAIKNEYNSDPDVLKSVHSEQAALLKDRPLAQIRKPEILFTILAVLALSILINLAFCIRCLLLRSYIDASNEGSSKTNCLAACLCLPEEMRKGSMIMTTPILPRTNMTPQMNHHVRMNGSDPAGFNSSYSLSALQKVPLLYNNGSSYKENLCPGYIPTNSLPGTFRKHGMPNLRNVNTPQPHSGGLIHHPQPIDPENHNLTAFTTMIDEDNNNNKFVNLTPTYIRAPSLNTPSPNLSRRVAVNNYGYSPQTAVRYIGQGDIHSYHPQYIIRVQHPHVVYDDVAAGSLGHSPNGSMLDAPGMHGHLTHIQSIKQNNMSQPINSSFSNLVNLPTDPNAQNHYISLQPSGNNNNNSNKPGDNKATGSITCPSTSSYIYTYSGQIQSDTSVNPSMLASFATVKLSSSQHTAPTTHSTNSEEGMKAIEENSTEILSRDNNKSTTMTKTENDNASLVSNSKASVSNTNVLYNTNSHNNKSEG